MLQTPASSCWPDLVRASWRVKLFCQEPNTRMAMNIANQTPSQMIYGDKTLSFMQVLLNGAFVEDQVDEKPEAVPQVIPIKDSTTSPRTHPRLKGFRFSRCSFVTLVF